MKVKVATAGFRQRSTIRPDEVNRAPQHRIAATDQDAAHTDAKKGAPCGACGARHIGLPRKMREDW